MNGLKQVSLALATAGALSSGLAQAGLESRAGGTMLYDNELNITWLADANHAKTSGYDADGFMNWDAAKTWADNLVYGGYDDWRLPTVLDTGSPGCDEAYGGTDCGYNVQTVAGGTVYSELAHMYQNNLGVKGRYNTSGVYQPDWGVFGNGTGGGQKDFALVKNLQSYAYWSGTAYAPDPASSAWYLSTDTGGQSYNLQNVGFHAWAVRPGDVAAPIPEPETYAMLLAGLGLLGVVARRRKQQSPV